MFKKLHLFLASLLLLSATTANANGTLVGNLYYLFDGTNATVTYPGDVQPTAENNAYTGDIVIPATVTYNSTTYNVTAIGNYAFAYSTITSVTFSEGLKTIGERAFYCCTGLTTVELPNSVETLGAQSFAGNGTYTMGVTTFRFGQNVTTADKFLYFNNRAKAEVYVPTSTVPYIGQYAIHTGGANVHVFPYMVKTFKADTWWNDSRYTIIGDLPGTKVQVGDFYYVIYTNGSAMLTYPGTTEPTESEPSTYTGSITIPETITYGGKDYTVLAVGSKAFYYSTITDVTFPSSVTNIGDDAFRHSRAMTSVTFSEGLKDIGEYAFYCCTGLTTVELPNSVVTLGRQAFAGGGYSSRMNIITFKFGKNITTCDKFLYFNTVNSLTDVYVPTYIVPYTGQYPVEGVAANRIHVYPSMVADFEANSYWARYNIIGDIAEQYPIINGLCYELSESTHTAKVRYMRGDAEPTASTPSSYTGDIVIPATVDYIGVTYDVTAVDDKAFAYSSITSVTFSEGLKTIGNASFKCCDGLTSVVLPNSLETMGSEPFAGTSSRQMKIKTFRFGTGFKSAGQVCVFIDPENTGSGRPTNVYVPTTIVPQIGDWSFANGGATIHVFLHMVEQFEATNWKSQFQDIVGDLEYPYEVLQELADQLSGYINYVGNDPGQKSQASYNNTIGAALTTFAALTTSSTAEQKTACATALLNAKTDFLATASNPITEGYYFIVTAGNGPGYSGGPYNYEDKSALYNAEDIVKWKAYDNTDACQVYYLTQKEDNSWYVYNVMDASYIDNGGTGNSSTVHTSTDKVNGQGFNPIDASPGKFAIKSPSYCYGTAYGNGVGHNGSAEDSGNLCIWGTVDDCKTFGVNVWYLHKISNADAEQLIANAVANTNSVVAMPTNETGGHTNVVFDGQCESLVLTDGQPFSAPSDFTASTATYTRAMTNEWGTICLPYDVSSNATTKYYTISAIENNALVVSEVATLTAGTPGLVQKVSGDAITATAANVPVSATIVAPSGNVKMYGVYEKTKVEDPNAYYIKDNKFWQCNNYFFCGAFRAYFTVSGAGSNSFSIVTDNDDPTAIASAEAGDNEPVAIYSTDGTRLGTLRSGINIVKQANGKTLIIQVK